MLVTQENCGKAERRLVASLFFASGELITPGALMLIVALNCYCYADGFVARTIATIGTKTMPKASTTGFALRSIKCRVEVF